MSKQAKPKKNNAQARKQEARAVAIGPQLSVGSVMDTWMQRSMSANTQVQAKLKIGETNDAFEREADQFAAKAIEKPAVVPILPAAKVSTPSANTLQAKPNLEAPVEKQEKKEVRPYKVRPKLQFSGSGGTDAPPNLGSSLSSLQGGFGLPAPLRNHYESLIGSDLSSVRLHTGLNAATMNQQIGARAFTYGQNIFFGAGQYDASSSAGQSLIAHEVAHTVQQGNREVVRRAPSSVEAFDYEEAFEPIPGISNAQLKLAIKENIRLWYTEFNIIDPYYFWSLNPIDHEVEFVRKTAWLQSLLNQYLLTENKVAVDGVLSRELFYRVLVDFFLDERWSDVYAAQEERTKQDGLSDAQKAANNQLQELYDFIDHLRVQTKIRKGKKVKSKHFDHPFFTLMLSSSSIVVDINSQGDFVAAIQTALAQLGYINFGEDSITGIFSVDDAQAIILFQHEKKQYHLKIDGKVGPKTLAALDWEMKNHERKKRKSHHRVTLMSHAITIDQQRANIFVNLLGLDYDIALRMVQHKDFSMYFSGLGNWHPKDKESHTVAISQAQLEYAKRFAEIVIIPQKKTSAEDALEAIGNDAEIFTLDREIAALTEEFDDASGPTGYINKYKISRELGPLEASREKIVQSQQVDIPQLYADKDRFFLALKDYAFDVGHQMLDENEKAAQKEKYHLESQFNVEKFRGSVGELARLYAEADELYEKGVDKALDMELGPNLRYLKEIIRHDPTQIFFGEQSKPSYKNNPHIEAIYGKYRNTERGGNTFFIQCYDKEQVAHQKLRSVSKEYPILSFPGLKLRKIIHLIPSIDDKELTKHLTEHVDEILENIRFSKLRISRENIMDFGPIVIRALAMLGVPADSHIASMVLFEIEKRKDSSLWGIVWSAISIGLGILAMAVTGPMGALLFAIDLAEVAITLPLAIAEARDTERLRDTAMNPGDRISDRDPDWTSILIQVIGSAFVGAEAVSRVRKIFRSGKKVTASALKEVVTENMRKKGLSEVEIKKVESALNNEVNADKLAIMLRMNSWEAAVSIGVRLNDAELYQAIKVLEGLIPQGQFDDILMHFGTFGSKDIADLPELVRIIQAPHFSGNADFIRDMLTNRAARAKLLDLEEFPLEVLEAWKRWKVAGKGKLEDYVSRLAKIGKGSATKMSPRDFIGPAQFDAMLTLEKNIAFLRVSRLEDTLAAQFISKALPPKLQKILEEKLQQELIGNVRTAARANRKVMAEIEQAIADFADDPNIIKQLAQDHIPFSIASRSSVRRKFTQRKLAELEKRMLEDSKLAEKLKHIDFSNPANIDLYENILWKISDKGLGIDDAIFLFEYKTIISTEGLPLDAALRRRAAGDVFDPKTKSFFDPSIGQKPDFGNNANIIPNDDSLVSGVGQPLSPPKLDELHSDYELKRGVKQELPDDPYWDQYRSPVRRDVNTASEYLGEESAKHLMLSNGYERLDVPIAVGHAKQGDFDQIWVKGDEIVIVEAKGHGGSYSTRKIRYSSSNQGQIAQQGTKEYLEEILSMMEQFGSSAHKELARKIRLAQKKGKLQYIEVRQKWNSPGGPLPPPEIRTFDTKLPDTSAQLSPGSRDSEVAPNQFARSSFAIGEPTAGGILASWSSRSLSSNSKVQAKLKIGESNDGFEREADQFAAKATLSKAAKSPLKEQEAKPVNIRRKLQFAGSGGTDAPPNFGNSLSSLQGGFGLPAPLRNHYESLIGSDLSSVRLHTGLNAATMNQQIGARAYTYGQNIFFGAGQYDPSSSAGQSLIAHEVAHTVQQGNQEVVRRAEGDDDQNDILTRQNLQSIIREDMIKVEHTATLQRVRGNPNAATTYRYLALLDMLDDQLDGEPISYTLSYDELLQKLANLAQISKDEAFTSSETPDFTEDDPSFSYGFPIYWAEKIRKHLYFDNPRAYNKVEKEAKEAYREMYKIRKTLPPLLAENGFPISVSMVKRLGRRERFQFSMLDMELPNATHIQNFVSLDETYQFNQKRVNYVSSWNASVRKIRDAQEYGNLNYLIPSKPESLVLSLQTLEYYIEYTQKLLPLFAVYNKTTRDHSPITLEMVASMITNGLKKWDDPILDGIKLFRAAEKDANALILKDKDGIKLEKAFRWAWDYGYFDEAARDMFQALKDNAGQIILETLAVIGGVALAQLVPGLNVAVDVVLILIGGFGAIDTISKLVKAISNVQDSDGVLALQKNAYQLASEMTGGVVELLVSLAMFLFGAGNKRRRAKADADNAIFKDYIDDLYRNGTAKQRELIDKARRSGNLGRAMRKAAAAETKANKGFISSPKSQFAHQRVNTIDELLLERSSQKPVGHFMHDKSTATEVMHKLAANDQTAFDMLGVQMGGKKFDTDKIEWGLAFDRKTKEYFIIKGNQPTHLTPGAVDWKRYIGKVDVLSHSHPFKIGGVKRSLHLGKGKSGLEEVLKSGDNQVMFLPSAEDIKFMLDHSVGRHTVVTPYRFNPKTKEIVNPDVGPNLPGISIEISAPKHLGKDDVFGHNVYEVDLNFNAGNSAISSKAIKGYMYENPNAPLLSLTKPTIGQSGAREGGLALFGKDPKPPSGPISVGLRTAYLKQFESKWFRFKLEAYAKISGKKVDWEALRSMVESAKFREYANAAEAAGSLGYAGIVKGDLVIGMAKPLRVFPILGKSSMQHELVHVFQELTGKTLSNEALMRNSVRGYTKILKAEFAANIVGSPAIFITALGFTVVIVGGTYYAFSQI